MVFRCIYVLPEVGRHGFIVIVSARRVVGTMCDGSRDGAMQQAVPCNKSGADRRSSAGEKQSTDTSPTRYRGHIRHS